MLDSLEKDVREHERGKVGQCLGEISLKQFESLKTGKLERCPFSGRPAQAPWVFRQGR
jgi:hypothetical protein